MSIFRKVDSKNEVTSTPVELPTSISFESHSHSNSVIENRDSKLFAKFFNTFQSSEEKQRSLPGKLKCFFTAMLYSETFECKLRSFTF